VEKNSWSSDLLLASFLVQMIWSKPADSKYIYSLPSRTIAIENSTDTQYFHFRSQGYYPRREIIYLLKEYTYKLFIYLKLHIWKQYTHDTMKPITTFRNHRIYFAPKSILGVFLYVNFRIMKKNTWIEFRSVGSMNQIGPPGSLYEWNQKRWTDTWIFIVS